MTALSSWASSSASLTDKMSNVNRQEGDTKDEMTPPKRETQNTNFRLV